MNKPREIFREIKHEGDVLAYRAWCIYEGIKDPGKLMPVQAEEHRLKLVNIYTAICNADDERRAAMSLKRVTDRRYDVLGIYGFQGCHGPFQHMRRLEKLSVEFVEGLEKVIEEHS